MPEVTFMGPAGRIEGRYRKSRDPNAPIALVLHPHPQHGGTMNNKVTYTIYHTFAENGFSVLRFNFRGIGRSEGQFENGEGELADAACALNWLQEQHPDIKDIWLGGFSFGAWIGMQLLMRRPEIKQFVTVGLPAKKYDFSFVAPCPAKGLVLHGKQDEIIDEQEVAGLVRRLKAQKGISVQYKTFPQAGHFFEKHLKHLFDEISGYIDKEKKKSNVA